jgi:hypothetical protein
VCEEVLHPLVLVVWLTLKASHIPSTILSGHPTGDALNPAPSWLPDRAWRQLRLLSALPAFVGIDAALSTDPEAWRSVYDSPEPQAAPLPGVFAGVDPFRRLCVLR